MGGGRRARDRGLRPGCGVPFRPQGTRPGLLPWRGLGGAVFAGFVEVGAAVRVAVASWLSGGLLDPSAGFGFPDHPSPAPESPSGPVPGPPLAQSPAASCCPTCSFSDASLPSKPDGPKSSVCVLFSGHGVPPTNPVNTHVREASRPLVPQSPSCPATL